MTTHQQQSETARGASSVPYQPQDHLVLVQTATGTRAHYPFCWRLHEFRLRYPAGILDAQIVQIDLERDLVIVKAIASEDSLDNCKGVGLQAGSVAHLNQITNHAKAQALADLGIGCGWPVLFAEDLDTAEIVTASAQAGEPVADETPANAQQSDQPITRTTEAVQKFFAKVYQVQPQDLEARWAKFCLGVLGRPLSKGALTQEELNKVNGIISQAWQKKQAGNSKSAA